MPYIKRRRLGFDHREGRVVYVRDVVVAGGGVTLTDFCDPKSCSNREVIRLHHIAQRS